MRSVSFLAAVGFATLVSFWGHSTGYAQEESREERYFRYLDRDGDGKIGREELQNLDDRMKERFKEAGLDPNQEVSRDRFMEGMRKRSENRERSRDGGAPAPAKGSKPAPKPRVTMTLTGNYVSLDKNGDQQIGLYEWDPAKRAEFFALDRNGDGFLTARELDDPPKTATTNAVMVSGGPPVAPSGGVPAGSASAGLPVKEVPAAPGVTESTQIKETPEVTRAKYFFSLTDKNKDGQISNDEWTASRGVRSMFEKGKITPTLPMTQADFIPQFQSLQKKSGS